MLPLSGRWQARTKRGDPGVWRWTVARRQNAHIDAALAQYACKTKNLFLYAAVNRQAVRANHMPTRIGLVYLASFSERIMIARPIRLQNKPLIAARVGSASPLPERCSE